MKGHTLVMLIGTIENGAIHLRDDVKLPEHGEVFVSVPGEDERVYHICSPRLANPEDYVHFEKKLVRIENDDEL